jgi:Amt family ammonium transporter
VIGFAAGFVCLWGVNGLKRMLRCGRLARRVRRARGRRILGALLTGCFCDPSLGGPGFPRTTVFEMKPGFEGIGAQV